MANIELDGANKKITVDSGDLTLDIPGDIILDADGGDLTFADGGTNLLKVTNSSSDVVLQPQVDAKDIKFNQYDGRTLLDINDGGFVGIANGATGPGQLRLYEDTDNGTNYTALQVGTQSGDITYTLPTADGSNGHALTTNGSGTLSWASAGTTYACIDDQSSSNDDQFTIKDAEVIINEDSDDVDFRVETNDNANMLFISGGNNVVGVGAEGDLGVGLHIKSADSGASVSGDSDELVIEGSANAGISILGGNGNACRIHFGDDGDNDIGFINYAHDDNALLLGTNATTQFKIASDGTLTATDTSIGAISSDQRLKENIQDYSYDISKFKTMKPRSFDWKFPNAHPYEAKIGFVAQELETVDSDLVITQNISENTNKPANFDDEKALLTDGKKKTTKLCKKDAMYISVIQQLITRIEALEG